jgi:hypothetical protein
MQLFFLSSLLLAAGAFRGITDAVPSKAPWMVLSLQVLIQLFSPSTIACLSPRQSITTVVVAVAAIAAGRGSSLRASGSARVGWPARG